jgi:rhodanese-related sulfurtransferase
MVQRIDVEDARRRVTSGGAVLVCAYADEAKCDRMRLEGSISLAQFESQAPSPPKDREIIFYCA